MIEMFRIVFAQIRDLNFHTKPAATTACDTFPSFPEQFPSPLLMDWEKVF